MNKRAQEQDENDQCRAVAPRRRPKGRWLRRYMMNQWPPTFPTSENGNYSISRHEWLFTPILVEAANIPRPFEWTWDASESCNLPRGWIDWIQNVRLEIRRSEDDIQGLFNALNIWNNRMCKPYGEIADVKSHIEDPLRRAGVLDGLDL